MLPAGTPCHTVGMAKRWRDETARNGDSLLERRELAEPEGEAEPADRADEPTKRRRIAGERRRSTAEAETDATTKIVSKPRAHADSASTDTANKDGDDSATRAQDMAATSALRTRLAAPAWATLTGLIVGGVLTGLVYAGMQAFQAIYNTPAGDGVGAVVLVAVLVASLLVGRLLLTWRGLHDPNATALLGILLMVIVTLGVLLPIVFTAWMLLVTPLLGAASYLISHLLVTHFGNPS